MRGSSKTKLSKPSKRFISFRVGAYDSSVMATSPVKLRRSPKVFLCPGGYLESFRARTSNTGQANCLATRGRKRLGLQKGNDTYKALNHFFLTALFPIFKIGKIANPIPKCTRLPRRLCNSTKVRSLTQKQITERPSVTLGALF